MPEFSETKRAKRYRAYREPTNISDCGQTRVWGCGKVRASFTLSQVQGARPGITPQASGGRRRTHPDELKIAQVRALMRSLRILGINNSQGQAELGGRWALTRYAWHRVARRLTLRYRGCVRQVVQIDFGHGRGFHHEAWRSRFAVETK